jgi:carboxymethylenebutenolidase
MLRDDLKTEFDALLARHATEAGASRRTALKAALGVGYAATALPIMAQTAIKTSAEGLTAGEVTIDVNGFKMAAYPCGACRQDRICRWCWSFRKSLACTNTLPTRRAALPRPAIWPLPPNCSSARATRPAMARWPSSWPRWCPRCPTRRSWATWTVPCKWAGANGGNAGKVGITGFCWGGRITWLYAAHNPGQGGRGLVRPPGGRSTPLTPKHPVDVAASLNGAGAGPVWRRADAGIPLDTIDKMKAVWPRHVPRPRRRSLWCTPTRPHAFHADYRPSYRRPGGRRLEARAGLVQGQRRGLRPRHRPQRPTRHRRGPRMRPFLLLLMRKTCRLRHTGQAHSQL